MKLQARCTEVRPLKRGGHQYTFELQQLDPGASGALVLSYVDREPQFLAGQTYDLELDPWP